VQATAVVYNFWDIQDAVGYAKMHWIVYAAVVGCKQYPHGVSGKGPTSAKKILSGVKGQTLPLEAAAGAHFDDNTPQMMTTPSVYVLLIPEQNTLHENK
jgi:hypothetical protein